MQHLDIAAAHGRLVHSGIVPVQNTLRIHVDDFEQRCILAGSAANSEKKTTFLTKKKKRRRLREERSTSDREQRACSSQESARRDHGVFVRREPAALFRPRAAQ